MSLSTWLAFFAACWAISFSPGPGAIAAMASGLRHGFRRGYWTTVGLIMGILCQVLIVSIGLGALLATSETAFTIVKWLGVIYLVYLGWKQFRTDAPPVSVEAGTLEPFRPRDLVMRGLLINLTNPKGTVFLLAVMPQFLDPAAPLPMQYVIIGLTLAFTDLVVMGIYTSLASSILKQLRKPRQIRWMNRAFGTLFILAGTALATLSQQK